MGKYKLANKFTLILSLIIILALTTGMSSQPENFDGKIFKNIYIENISIGKKTFDEAVELIYSKHSPKPICIKYEEKTWCIKPQDIDLIYIENISIGKKTFDEAVELIYSKHSPKPICIKYEEKTWCIKPQDIDLNYNIEDAVKSAYFYTRSDNKLENIKRKGNLQLNNVHNIKLNATYSESKLTEQILYIQNEINKSVKQATLKIEDNGSITTTPSKSGIEVDIGDLKEKIYDMIKNKDIKCIDLPVRIINPTITTEQVKSVNSILGQFSTSFNNNSSRGSNIYVAGKSTSDILLMPGEVFSYNKATGARTWSNGYKTAKVIVGGKYVNGEGGGVCQVSTTIYNAALMSGLEIQEVHNHTYPSHYVSKGRDGKYVNGEGGGVCQVSTTIYNAALMSGLEIQEVHNHTYPSHYVSKGRDAAVSYGYIDLKFKNNFAHPIYIKNIVSNGAITSKIYGCNQDREKLYIRTQESRDKDKIIVKTYRVYLGEENNKIREELVSENKYKIK